MRSARLTTAAAALLTLAGCGGAADQQANNAQVVSEPLRPLASELPAGTTPMAERVAVVGLLNKRNGISQDVTLRPGQAVRLGNVIIRLRACETTAPWEPEQLTGAFVQLDVANPQGQFQRVFSGWIWKEAPSLNVVEHPIYDVWTKSCAMTHPASAASTEAAEPASNTSSASNAAAARRSAPRPAEVARPKATPPSNSAEAASNSAVSNSR